MGLRLELSETPLPRMFSNSRRIGAMLIFDV